MDLSSFYTKPLPLNEHVASAISCEGFCPTCNTQHNLSQGNCLEESQRLIQIISNKKSVDIYVKNDKKNKKCDIEYLHGKARGKMFGVMECLRDDGSTIFLHAFSGQYNGLWDIDGWVPPLLNRHIWYKTNYLIEKEIKKLSRDMEDLTLHSPAWNTLRKKRRELSRDLMHTIHSLYKIRNFRGESLPLTAFFKNDRGIPTGTGDCCAPKLLNHAILHNLTPVGMIEFYLGKENKSRSKKHGVIYASCKEKCQPIIGFMLCGLKKNPYYAG